jgi:exonuclease, DNA polymerase III, epsilon subunit family
MSCGVARESKGNSLLELRDDYIVVDFETTGLDPRECEIIEIGAIKIEKGRETERFYTLIQPYGYLDPFITSLTGITEDDLKNQPYIESVWGDFLAFLGDNIVVGHNANFDINFAYETSKEVLSVPFKNDFICTMRMSRKLFKEHRHHRLTDLVERFDIHCKTAHRALSDCENTRDCYEYMKNHIIQNDIDVDAVFKSYHGNSMKSKNIKTEKRAFDEESPMFDKVFVFTGSLEKMLRKDAMQIVVDAGGNLGDNVTSKTSFLVLGNNDFCKSIKGGKSNKQKKAEQLKLSGQDIEIISENVFYDMIDVILKTEVF